MISKREFKKLVKECKDYKTTKAIITECINGKVEINFDMFQDLMDLLGYYGIKEEIN